MNEAGKLTFMRKNDKNDPTRFLGEGITFKAKLIGILEVNEARGDKMCQDALNDLKTAIRAAGEHKQRITISIAIDGLRLRDEKTAECMYHHPVHKISFIAQDMSDSRAFGYIFGSPDTGHRFFGIKTDKTASQVVISMRDLFQVVFELKKKEIELAKHQHQLKFGSGNGTKLVDGSAIKDDSENKKIKSDSRCITEDNAEALKSNDNSEAIADLLDLEDELNNIQQGINQMERITPSDPFGPLKDSFADSFAVEDSRKPSTSSFGLPTKSSGSFIQRSGSQSSSKEPDSGIFSASATSSHKAQFFSQYSPTKPNEPKHWFDKETEGIFNETETQEVTSPPASTNAQEEYPIESGLELERLQPTHATKADLFTDLDPLGTGKVKPYMDKKDFFQELKNPPKKVLKELITDPTKNDDKHYFQADFEVAKGEQSYPPIDISGIVPQGESESKELSTFKVDPFEDNDPFDKADPFLESSFPKSIGFPPLTLSKTLNDTFQERRTSTGSNRYDKVKSRSEELPCSTSPSKSIFSTSFQGALRVSLPPEKTDISHPITLSSITSRFRSSPSPTEEPRTFRRRHYQTLKQSVEGERVEYNGTRYGENFGKQSPRMDRRSLPSDIAPIPPPKSSLITIKPPPLPPKKGQRPQTKTPSPITVSETRISPQENRQNKAKLRNASLERKKDDTVRRHNSDLGPKIQFPLLPPPPARKSQLTGHSSKPSSPVQLKEDNSVFNITLNQLDQSGLRNLALTLGISTENVCNMTLQELTKRLAQKYLGPNDESQNKEIKQDEQQVTFKADFETMFKNGGSVEQSPYFDKYAPFKELIAVNQVAEDTTTVINDNDDHTNRQPSCDTPSNEDKYAALRQLSLCTQKSENLSEELDVSNEEDSSARADMSDIMKQHTDESFTPLHSSDMISESPIVKFADWNQMTLPEEEIDAKDDNPTNAEAAAEPNQKQLEKQENWPILDSKTSTTVQLQATTKDNSPSTSEGKDESSKFVWPKSKPRPGETPWNDDDDDDDDDYSPKDLQWSDESSPDCNSPISKNGHRRLRKCRKHTNKDYQLKWVDRSDPMPGNKWMEDTEDEYEEMRRRRRQRPSSFDRDRRRDYHEKPYDRYDRHWDSRYGQPYRRTSGDQDNYYKRCESDGSEREYSCYNYDYNARYPYSARDPMHWADQNREARGKIKKPETSKRPSSAASSKRTYERNYVDRCLDKPFRRENEQDETSGFRNLRKDSRQPVNDYQQRKWHTLHHKRVSRLPRGHNLEGVKHPEPSSAEMIEKRHFFPPDTSKDVALKKDSKRVSTDQSFDGFEDDFTPSPIDKFSMSTRNVDSPCEAKLNDDEWGRKESSVNDDAFSPVDTAQPATSYDMSPKKTRESPRSAQQRPSIRSRNYYSVRQDSSSGIRKSESINIFSRDNDPFEDDDFFTDNISSGLNRFAEKSKSNTNVSDPFTWTEVFGD